MRRRSSQTSSDRRSATAVHTHENDEGSGVSRCPPDMSCLTLFGGWSRRIVRVIHFGIICKTRKWLGYYRCTCMIGRSRNRHGFPRRCGIKLIKYKLWRYNREISGSFPRQAVRTPLARSRSTVPVQSEIIQELRSRAGDQVADQLRSKKAECDAVAAISIGGKDALLAGHGTDQG
jgi:hypothetical protein